MDRPQPHNAINANAVSSVIIVAGLCCSILLISSGHDPSTISLTSEDIIKFSVLWVASLLGGYTLGIFNIALLGSLIVGIILSNSFEDFKVPHQLADFVRTVSLSIILIMSSLEMNVDGIRDFGLVCVRLTTLPGMIEAIIGATCSVLLFEIPITLALVLGYLLSAVSPAIVVPGMMSLKSKGFGVEKGIPSLVMAAASMDDIVALTGFTVSLGIALDTESRNVFLSIFLHGPLQLFIGVAIGFVLGLAFTLFARLCSSHWQRTLFALELSTLVSYFFKNVHLDGVGPIATLVMGATVSILWKQKRFIDFVNPNGYLETNPTTYLYNIVHALSELWEIAFRPLLFASIGAALDFKTLSGNNVLNSCVIVIISVIARALTAYASVGGRNFTRSERQFISMAWIPKATIQAVLCTIPLALVEERIDSSEQLITWAVQIKTTAIVAILLTAPTGLVAMQVFGPRLLSQKELVSELNIYEKDDVSSPKQEERVSSPDKQLSPVSA